MPFLRLKSDDGDGDHAADDVQRVKPCGRVVEVPESVRLKRVPEANLVGPLKALDDQEASATKYREHQVLERLLPIAHLGSVVGEDCRQTRGEQDDGIDCTRHRIGVRGVVTELDVPDAVHQVRHQHAAKNDDFRPQQPPNGQASSRYA